MNFEKYLKRKDLSIKDFAKITKLSHATIYQMMHGRDVHVSTLLSIEDASEGRCKAAELINDYIRKPKKKEII